MNQYKVIYIIKMYCSDQYETKFANNTERLNPVLTNQMALGDPLQVQVARLGRSMSLSKRAHDVTSTSCVVQRDMPADSTRW